MLRTGVMRSTVAAIGLAMAAGPMSGCVVGSEEEEPTLEELEHKSGPEPVIWVHGCPPPFANNEMVSHFTDPQRAFFAQQGYDPSDLHRFVFQGAQCGSNIDMAIALAEYVHQVRANSGWRKVDLVTHSMGAVTARLYMKYGGHWVVDDFVSIAGTNHGAEVGVNGIPLQNMFGAPAYEGMKEMYPPYACKGEASGGAADVQWAVNGCLTPTGRSEWRDETPGNVDYLSIRNTLDGEVAPNESSCLDQKFQNDCSSDVNVAVAVGPGPGPCGPAGCPPHVTVLFDPAVMQMVYDHVK